MNALMQLLEHGQSYWLDTLTRHMIEKGELRALIERTGLRGVTTNPAIFNTAIGKSDDYDGQIAELAARGQSTAEIDEALAVTDVRTACDVLRSVYDETQGRDGFVSLEVSPHLARDTQGSIQEARRLFQAVARPNVMIKIPGTPEGVPAVEQLLFEGINVNITLLFSIESYEAVAWAYVRALERRAQQDLPLDRLASVASFFLSRIDSLVDTLLAQRQRKETHAHAPPPEGLLGKAAIANAKLAYARFQQIRASDRFQALMAKGARVQRMLWASTSTKNPKYRDVMYVEALIGPDTVNTLPMETVIAFEDHGRVATTIDDGLDESRRVMDDLAALGIDFAQVTDQLLREGIQKFIEPYDALLRTIDAKRRAFLSRETGKPAGLGPGTPPVL